MCVTCVCIVEEYSRGLKGAVDGGWGGVGGRFERGGGSQGRARLDVGRGWGGTQLGDRFVSFVCVYALCYAMRSFRSRSCYACTHLSDMFRDYV